MVDCKKEKFIASIDIGSNSLLMLGLKFNGQSFNKMFDHFFMPRLAENFALTGLISKQAIERAKDALLTCKTILDEQQQPYQIFITASSAIREASNQEDVIATLEKCIDHKIEIISGEEEARLSYLSLYDHYLPEKTNMVFDIGGGSTECMFGHGKKFEAGQSFKFGSVKCLDLFFKDDLTKHLYIEDARLHIKQHLKHLSLENKHLNTFYGTAGSFTHTVSYLLKLKTYDPEQINGYKLTYQKIQDAIAHVSMLSIKKIQALVGVDAKRADVLLPSMIIIESLMQHFEIEIIHIFDRGIRYGKCFDIAF